MYKYKFKGAEESKSVNDWLLITQEKHLIISRTRTRTIGNCCAFQALVLTEVSLIQKQYLFENYVSALGCYTFLRSPFSRRFSCKIVVWKPRWKRNPKVLYLDKKRSKFTKYSHVSDPKRHFLKTHGSSIFIAHVNIKKIFINMIWLNFKTFLFIFSLRDKISASDASSTHMFFNVFCTVTSG